MELPSAEPEPTASASALKPLLSVVVPALNEEQAVGDTLRRCLAARAQVQQRGGLRGVELILVSDGSTDRTEQIALALPEVTVLGFERNRGYGAAIKAGFAYARGELLGFLDADGTCDPAFFGELSAAITSGGADVATGSRLGHDTGMPWIRSVGNQLFAWLLGLLSVRSVRDTASGMRVVRRDRLSDLYPLPNGLQFTPAMTARVFLEGKLRLVELPMPYAERVGRSKLSVVRDGLRFLRVIVQAALCYRPARPLLLVAVPLLVVGGALALTLPWHYLRSGGLEEWMIYRTLFASLLVTTAAVLVTTAVLAERIAASAHGRPPTREGATGLVSRLFEPVPRRLAVALLVVAAVGVAWPGLVEYVTTAHVNMHWSRPVFASLLLVIAGFLATTGLLLGMMDLIRTQRRGEGLVRPPDRVRPGADV